MHNNLPPEAHNDYFHPPSVPTEVWCLHCGKSYDSYLIEWREESSSAGRIDGRWVCPMPGCGGAGFGFDIYPTDPDYIDPDGRDITAWDDDDEDDEFDDELMCDDDDDYEDDEQLAELVSNEPELPDQPFPSPLPYGRLREYFDSLDDDIPY